MSFEVGGILMIFGWQLRCLFLCWSQSWPQSFFDFLIRAAECFLLSRLWWAYSMGILMNCALFAPFFFLRFHVRSALLSLQSRSRSPDVGSLIPSFSCSVAFLNCLESIFISFSKLCISFSLRVGCWAFGLMFFLSSTPNHSLATL